MSEAVEAAERFAAMIDAGRYADSWDAAGLIFRRNVTKEAWSGAAGAVREPLGALVSRTLLAEEQTKSLPGVPDGDYATIQFTTTFAQKASAVETVALAHEAEGWKVVGFFIR